jgi:hypothetical protein
MPTNPRLRDLRRLRALGLSYAKCGKYADQAAVERLRHSLTRATLPAWSAQPQPATRSLSLATIDHAYHQCSLGGHAVTYDLSQIILAPRPIEGGW